MAFSRNHTPFLPDWNRIGAAGAALSVNVRTVLDSHSAALLLRQQLYDLLAAGQKLTLTLVEAGRADEAERNISVVFGVIAAVLRDVVASPRDIGIVVDSASLMPKTAWQVRRDHLGTGALFVSIPQRSLTTEFWEQAWRLRGNEHVSLVYAPHVVSQTRLLPDERAPGVLPELRAQVPTGSAWILARLDLTEHASAAGIVDETSLEDHIADVVQHADELHSSVRWPTAQMRHDAWLNRRVAINITGVGAIVQQKNIDPGRLGALNELNELLQCMKQMLFTATHGLAIRDGIVPALDQADPGRLLPGGRIGEGWAWRWRQALEAAAVRNRNLLAMSPWSLFPPGAADFRYTNLLPLLRHADVCSFAGQCDNSHWNPKDFKSFHQQAAAVLHQRGAARQIAVHA